MTVRVYYSTDAGAPVLSGTAGALIGVLDACLVNGYGSKAGAGWTKAFSGTNKAAYKQPVGSNGFYFRADDTGTTVARIVGYEAMTGIDTGSAAFPTEVQFAGGLYVAKSSAGDATARPWELVTNGNICYVHVNQAAHVTSDTGVLIAFGDFMSYKSGDAYGTVLIAAHANSVGTSPSAAGSQICIASTTVLNGHYVARSHTQLGSSVQVGKHTDVCKSNTVANMGISGLTYPNPSDGGLYLAPVWLNEVSTVRGMLPGLWSPLHAKPLGNLDIFSGSGSLVDKSFLALNVFNAGQIVFETSDTW